MGKDDTGSFLPQVGYEKFSGVSSDEKFHHGKIDWNAKKYIRSSKSLKRCSSVLKKNEDEKVN